MAVDYSWAPSWILLHCCLSWLHFELICNNERLWVVTPLLRFVIEVYDDRLIYVSIMDIPVTMRKTISHT